MSAAERRGPGDPRSGGRAGAPSASGASGQGPSARSAARGAIGHDQDDDEPESFGPDDRLARAQRLAAARGIVTGSTRKADQDELLAALQGPLPEPQPASLEDVRAAPGEVPMLHSDRSLYFLWVSLALVVIIVAALGTWVMFLRQPF